MNTIFTSDRKKLIEKVVTLCNEVNEKYSDNASEKQT